MAVEEKIVLDSTQFVGSAESAATAIDGVTDSLKQAEDQAQKTLQAMADFAKGSEKAVGSMNRPMGKFLGVRADKDWRNLGKNQEQAKSKFEQLKDAVSDLFSKGNQRNIDSSSKSMSNFGKVGAKAGAVFKGIGIAIGIFVAGIAAMYKIAEPFVKAAAAADIARDSFRGALDQVTGGRGEAALKWLDKLAKGLNLPVEQVTEQFIALREKGISNIDSESLIKLRADLIAVGVSAAEADKQIDATAEAIKKGADAGDAIQKVADKFGAMGDGANASAASVYTLKGALELASNAGDRLVARLADKAGPSFDNAAQSIAGWITKFEESAAAEAILNAIAAAIDAVVEAGEGFMSVLEPALEGLEGPMNELASAFGETTDGANAARTAGAGLGQIVSLLVSGFGMLISAAASVISAWNSFTEGVSAVRDALSGIYNAIAGFDLSGAASDLVQGFINGIKNMAGAAIQAAKDMAQGAVDAVKGALKIGSPSKVALDMGENFGDSFTDAMNDSMPDDIAMAVPANTNALKPAAAKPASSGGRGVINLNVTVNVSGTNASADDIAGAVQRGAEQALRLAGVA